MSEPQLLQPEQRVLSTLENSGKRRWLRPRLSKGRFLLWRRVVGYALILLFAVLPYITINGQPALLFDVIRREFHVFGKTFWPTDFFLLALLGIGTLVSIFLVTSLFGRVWCGWGCPQTVYMELVYRPIERLFEGTGGKGGKPARPVAGWRQVARFVVYLVISMFLAHVFLAYFVGVDQLFTWVQGSPLNHPVAFGVMAFTTGLMMFDFCYFREQMCILACPYGRFQSVLLDRQSLIISYDPVRGEPRGPLTRKRQGVSLPVVAEESSQGDCIDCHMCVTTCPTGIDIREGLQFECVNCAQCIDACDTVMDKIGKPRGLIRYSSQEAIEGRKPRLLRPRVILYPLVIFVIVGLFVATLGTKSIASVAVLRTVGMPYYEMPDGRIGNTLRVEIANRTDAAMAFSVSLEDVSGIKVKLEPDPITLDPGERRIQPVQVFAPRAAFDNGVAYVTLVVTGGDGDYRNRSRVRLLGPVGPPAATPAPEPAKSGTARPPEATP